MTAYRPAGLLAALAFLVGCEPGLTEEELALSDSLRARLTEIEVSAQEAASAAEEYGDGLLGALTRSRYEVALTTALMLEQRINQLQSGSPVTVATTVTDPDTARFRELEAEIQSQERELAKARQEAAQYQGGLLAALAESKVATHELTLAFLRQASLIAKYGLSVPGYAVDSVLLENLP